jgi:glycosyltransferase involved in cell wall biosynthesis
MEILIAAGVPNRREGGVAAMIYNYGRELEARGHKVSYVFFEDLISKEEAAGRFRDLRFAWRLARYIVKNRNNYSVVNLHAPTGLFYGPLRRISPGTGRLPYVMTLHGLEERRIHVMSREVKKGRAWHYSFRNRLWQHMYHMPRYFACIKTADYAHCISRDVWTVLQLQYNLDGERVAFIPHGVEERFFSDRSYGDQGVLRLLYAGTWLDQRGIFYIRDALQSLNRKFQNWTFTIAGGGVPADQLKTFFGDSLRDQILVEDVVPADRMPDLYAAHDALLFPSLMEGLPSVLLEAMASGMTVITTETCGMPDLVENGYNGMLVPPADAIAIESAILEIGKSVDLRARLGRAARESMRRYTWQRSALQFEKVLISAAGMNPCEQQEVIEDLDSSL